MTSEYHIDPTNRFGAIRFPECLAGQKLLDDLRLFFEREEWSTGFRVLYNARATRKLDLTPDDVAALRALTGEFRPRIGPGRSAIVGSSEDVLTMGKLMKALAPPATGRVIEVFEDLHAAVDWLGVDEESGLLPPGPEEPPAGGELHQP